MVYRELRKTTPTLLAIAAMLVLALLLGGCGKPVPPADSSALPPVQPAVVSAPTVPAGDPLTRGQAETVALNHAGLTADQVRGLRSEFDIDDGVQVWDVEFWHDGWEYDYEINAVSGTIRAFDKDRD